MQKMSSKDDLKCLIACVDPKVYAFYKFCPSTPSISMSLGIVTSQYHGEDVSEQLTKCASEPLAAIGYPHRCKASVRATSSSPFKSSKD